MRVGLHGLVFDYSFALGRVAPTPRPLGRRGCWLLDEGGLRHVQGPEGALHAARCLLLRLRSTRAVFGVGEDLANGIENILTATKSVF